MKDATGVATTFSLQMIISTQLRLSVSLLSFLRFRVYLRRVFSFRQGGGNIFTRYPTDAPLFWPRKRAGYTLPCSCTSLRRPMRGCPIRQRSLHSVTRIKISFSAQWRRERLVATAIRRDRIEPPLNKRHDIRYRRRISDAAAHVRTPESHKVSSTHYTKGNARGGVEPGAISALSAMIYSHSRNSAQLNEAEI